MKGWREFVQRWVLRSAIRQGRKASQTAKIEEKAGILLVLPRDETLAHALLEPLREWITNLDSGAVRVVLPASCAEGVKSLSRSISTIPVGADDITRSLLPTHDLRRHLQQTPSRLAVLLTEEPDPFTEVLFAITPSTFKAALFHISREGYASLLVQPRSANGGIGTIQFLLDAILTFAGNRIPTKATPDSQARAAKRFSGSPA